MPECKVFEHGVCIGPGGNIRPCCAWKDDPSVNSLHWEDNWQEHHRKLGELSKTSWLPECAECKQSELAGKRSMRQDLLESLAGAEGIEYWDLKINNTCNLACRMCDAWSSSKWAELVGIPGLHTGPVIQDKWHKSALDFVPEMLFAREIKFTGGEPFLIPQVKHILEKLIELDAAPGIKLQFVTNATQDMTVWCSLFESFREVSINVSVDALGKRYEYIRPHGVWPETERRIFELRDNMPANCYITVTCTEMILNTHHIDEVAQWSKQNGFGFQHSGPILFPDHLRVDALERCPDKFKEQMNILDAQYGTDWRDFVNAPV